MHFQFPIFDEFNWIILIIFNFYKKKLKGCWDSIHIVEAIEGDDKQAATYKLTTTIILYMAVDKVQKYV